MSKLLTLIWLAPLLASAVIIPPERLVPWTPGVTVGVPGGIPTYRTNLTDATVSPYFADKTGATDASTAIQAAIDGAVSNDVVYLPAGTYRLDATLSINNKSGITLRGEGTNTHVIPYGSASFVYVGSSSDYAWITPAAGNTITSGLSKGSTNIIISNTLAFIVGHIAQISLKNDTNIPVINVFGYENSRRQKVLVTAKTSTSLTIWPPLYDDYSAVTAKVYRAQFQSSYVGIEDIDVDGSNSSNTFIIYFEQCYASWVNNVTTHHAANYHIFLYDSLNCEVRHCFLDQLNHVGSNGAGLLVNTCSGCWFEDNIIYKAFPLIEVNLGSSGNVFSYNFMEDSSVFGAYGTGIDSNHGPHNSFNLYEGNVCPNLQCDGYFGGASRDTLFRNWFHGKEPGITNTGRAVTLNRFTRDYSLVGNVLGNPIYPRGDDGVVFGEPNLGNGDFTGYGPPWSNALHSAGSITASQTGKVVTASSSIFVAADVGRWIGYVEEGDISVITGLTNATIVGVADTLPITNLHFYITPGQPGWQELDTNVQATVIQKGNYDYFTGGVPVGQSYAGSTLSNSMVYPSTPSWWTVGKAWPPIGPDVGGLTVSIPAQDRYNATLPVPPSTSITLLNVGTIIQK